MAIFDLVTALAWSFATLPIDDTSGYSIYGAKGSEASCRAQGFFIQLGLISVFYNVSLATYYWLVLACGWKETALRKISLWLVVLPIVFGLGLALGGLPYYKGLDYACHLVPYPSGDLWTVLVFAICPISFSILVITVTMARMYCVVRSKLQSAENVETFRLQKFAFYQCLFYTISFYVTWPIVLCVYITGWDFEKKVYGFSIVVAFVAPLQGCSNGLSYARPRLAKLFTRMSQTCFHTFLSRPVRRDVEPNDSSLFGGRNTTRQLPDSFRAKDNNSSTVSGSNMTSRERHRYHSVMDPSVAIAEDSSNAAAAAASGGGSDDNENKNPLHGHEESSQESQEEQQEATIKMEQATRSTTLPVTGEDVEIACQQLIMID
jgi:hypothetical protein